MTFDLSKSFFTKSPYTSSTTSPAGPTGGGVTPNAIGTGDSDPTKTGTTGGPVYGSATERNQILGPGSMAPGSATGLGSIYSGGTFNRVYDAQFPVDPVTGTRNSPDPQFPNLIPGTINTGSWWGGNQYDANGVNIFNSPTFAQPTPPNQPATQAPPTFNAAQGPTGVTGTGLGAGGLMPGTPFMQGVDMTVPGAAEQYYAQHQGDFSGPTGLQTFANSAMSQYGGAHPVSQNAQTAYQNFAGSTPATLSNNLGSEYARFGAQGPAQMSQNTQGVFQDFQNQAPANVTQNTQGAYQNIMNTPNAAMPGAGGQVFGQLNSTPAANLPQFGTSVYNSVAGSRPADLSANADAAYAAYAGSTPADLARTSMEAFQDFKRSTPADMSGYYDNAGRQAMERLNSAMAAKGVYGSSASNDAASEALTNLAADRAKNEANYGLSRAGLEGTLGASASTESLNAGKFGLDQYGLLGNMASAADASSLARGNYGLNRQGLLISAGQAADTAALGAANYGISRGNMLTNAGQAADAATEFGANYGLNRMSLGLQGAQAADQSSLNAANYGLNRTGLLGNLAGQADANSVAQANYGLNREGILANLAQGADANSMNAANYGLNRAGLMGNLASAADASSLNADANQRNWMNSLGSLMQGADQGALARTQLGGALAGQAQGAQTTRGQNAFMNQMTMGNALSGVQGDVYGGANNLDTNLLLNALGMFTGTGAEGFSQASNANQQARTDQAAQQEQMMRLLQLLGSTANNLKPTTGPGGPAP